jgi:hypothetical protein
MDKQTPSKPQRVKKDPLPPVSNPLTQEDREEFNENKYARRTNLIGKSTIGRPNRVESVGLGNLKVQTSYGIQPDV